MTGHPSRPHTDTCVLEERFFNFLACGLNINNKVVGHQNKDFSLQTTTIEEVSKLVYRKHEIGLIYWCSWYFFIMFVKNQVSTFDDLHTKQVKNFGF